MFETAKKYSEQVYYNKADLEKEMDFYLVDPLWHEITQYRSLFRHEFPIKEKKTYLIRNPHVNDQMSATQNLLFEWLLLHKEDPDKEFDLFWLKEEEQLRFLRLLVKLRYDHSLNPQTLFQEVMDSFQLHGEVNQQTLQYLSDAQNPLLLKLFRLGMEGNKRTAFLLLFPTLYLHHCLKAAEIIDMEEIIDKIHSADTDLDVTSAFLSLLVMLRLKLSDEMISLKRNEQLSPLDQDEVNLCERYPMLQKESIAFYVRHRKLHHYYTLQDYMKEADVCYETARYSMEKLVELKWYQKQKIGKKFVYFII